ncbi:MAG: efflux RND transporter periplasmic adaptor subunit [Myxococcota bacterium]|nr:efflux RND transporter periplasmic adaptor subunit [Myxococcota bacterium]
MASRPPPPNVWQTVVAAALTALVACGGEPEVSEPLIRPVRTARVQSTGSEQVRSFTGSTKAGAEIALSFKVPGTIMRLLVRLGDPVVRGQLIAQLEPSDYELREGEARATRALRFAEQRNAEAQYDRVRALYENNNASRTELDAARARAESAGSLLEAHSKTLELATKQLSYTRLEAPVDGLVSEVPGDENENVAAGQTTVVLTSGALPEVEIAIPSHLIAQVKRDDIVKVSLPSIEGPPLPATVIEVGVSAGAGRSTFPVTARLHEDHPAIRPGMAAEVEFRFAAEGEGRLLVPTVAVGEDRQGRFVFVFETGPDGLGTARRRAVEIGSVSVGGLEILSGLREGETVITAGVRRIQDGLPVRLLDPPEPDRKAHQ